LSFDLAASLRRLKPQKRISPLKRRSDDVLTFVTGPVEGGSELLLDTNVYLDVLQARIPDPVKQLLAVRTVNHSAIAIAELTYAFGRLDPSHAQTKAGLATIREAVAAIPPRRLTAPSVQAVAEAGMLAGLVARLRGLAKPDRHGFLNDAILYLQALEQGHTILTRNIADFDALQQLIPAGRILLYRREA
jgi:predicted nucleic acid-binding protein